MVTRHNAPQTSNPEIHTEYPPQNNLLLPQFNQPQNKATHISPDDTLSEVKTTAQSLNSDSGNPINRPAKTVAGIAP